MGKNTRLPNFTQTTIFRPNWPLIDTNKKSAKRYFLRSSRRIEATQIINFSIAYLNCHEKNHPKFTNCDHASPQKRMNVLRFYGMKDLMAFIFVLYGVKCTKLKVT